VKKKKKKHISSKKQVLSFSDLKQNYDSDESNISSDSESSEDVTLSLFVCLFSFSEQCFFFDRITQNSGTST
jgi:hypothetical protein